ncbi:unnamed protein product [Pleuronectes platessa]|uniref:Uncharacterized protein n=1 Tax=Pleuronectes platessa TaxID=8262 RepID=A0A9N7UJ10_PLEPL|nr:unnamed protein product [Pleuronectes platessa]
MRGKQLASQLNTLQPLHHGGVCAQGYTGLIRNGSVAFSEPLNHSCPHLLSLSSFPPSASFHRFFFYVMHFSALLVALRSSRGTHLRQVNRRRVSDENLINILKPHRTRLP